MASVNPTLAVSTESVDGSLISIIWTPLTSTNLDGVPAEWGEFADRTVQVNGTFGASGSVTLEGSMDGTNWYPLTKPGGTAATFTAAGLCAIVELTKYVKPLVTISDGTTALTITLFMRRANPMRT